MHKKIHLHVKKHGFKYMAGLGILSILTTAFVFRPSQSRTAQAAASSEWNHIMHSANTTYEEYAKVVRSSGGNYYVAWEESATFGSQTDIKMGKYDIDGNLLGSIITVSNNAAEVENDLELAPDNSDGVQIVYVRHLDIIAAHYNSSGSQTCSNAIYRGNVNPAGGGNKDQQREFHPTLMHDGNGGMYVGWQSINIGNPIYITHLGADCNVDTAWAPTVTNYGPFKAIEATDIWAGDTLKMISGGSNSMIWAGEYFSYTNPRNVTIHKISNTGEFASGWTGTKFIDPVSATGYSIDSDGNGGAVVAHTPGDVNNAVRLTHLKSDGTADTSWGGTGTLSLMTSLNSALSLQVINDSFNNFIVTWNDGIGSGQYNNYAQKVAGGDGQILWGEGDPVRVLLSTSGSSVASEKSLVADNNGGAYSGYFSEGNRIIQNIKSDGSRDFGDYGYNEQSASQGGLQQAMVADGQGGVIAIRKDGLFDVYGEHLKSISQIESVSPNFSYINASNVTVNITGTSLAGMNTATVGGEDCTVLTKTNLNYTCMIASIPNTPGLANIYLSGPLRNTGTSGNGIFQIYGPPAVTDMYPENGAMVGGTDVTFTGSGFGSETTVLFGANPATIVSVESDTLVVTTPAGVAGDVAVTVTNPGNQSTSGGTFTYNSYPAEGVWPVNNLSIDGFPIPDPLTEDNPHTVTASDGNFIVTWGRNGNDGDKDLFVQKLNRTTGAHMWGESGGGNGGTQITDLGANVYSQSLGTNTRPNIVADNNGGAYIIWQEDHPVLSQSDLMMQHVMGNGSVQYGGDGLNLTNNPENTTVQGYNIISDNSGGVFVSGSNTDMNTWNNEAFVVRVNTAGTVIEMQTGVGFPIGSLVPALALDNNNNVYVAYSVIDTNTSIHTFEVQRFFPDGSKAAVGQPWANTFNMPLVDGERINTYDITVDGSGSIIVVYYSWVDPNGRLAVQKIDTDGFFSYWFTAGVGGIPLVSSLGNPGALQIIPDGSDGTIAVWNDTNNGTIYAQKIDTEGIIQWGVNGLQVSSGAQWDTLSSSNSLTSDGAGGAIVAFTSQQSRTKLVLQSINSAGALQFPEAAPTNGGYESFSNFTNNGDFSPAVTGDGLGGVAVFWVGITDIGGGMVYEDIYGQYYNTNPPVGGGCSGTLGANQVCGSQTIECPIAVTNFTVQPSNFQMGSTGSRLLRNINDSSYSADLNSAFFEAAPTTFTDAADTVTINSNIPWSCGAPADAVSLTVSATPFVSGTGDYLMTYGADLAEDTPAFSVDDYAAMFSVITSDNMTCTGSCIPASGTVETFNARKNGQSNYFNVAGPNDKTHNQTGFDANALLVDNDNTLNTVTLYQASQGFFGDLTVPGLDFAIFMPADLANSGSFSSTVTYTLS